MNISLTRSRRSVSKIFNFGQWSTPRTHCARLCQSESRVWEKVCIRISYQSTVCVRRLKRRYFHSFQSRTFYVLYGNNQQPSNLILDWDNGFTLYDNWTNSNVWTYKFSELRGSSDDHISRLKLHFNDLGRIETKVTNETTVVFRKSRTDFPSLRFVLTLSFCFLSYEGVGLSRPAELVVLRARVPNRQSGIRRPFVSQHRRRPTATIIVLLLRDIRVVKTLLSRNEQ